MSAVHGRYPQDDPVRGQTGGQVHGAGQPVAAGPPPEEDADLAAAVRSTTRMRTAFYVVVLLIALGGQVSGAMEALGMPWYVALPAVGALELGGMVVLANADVRRRLGEHATLSRLLSAAIAFGAVAFNWLAHANHLEGGFYGGMSLLGYLVWLMNTENKRRDRLRAKRQLPPTPPAYEVVGHWLRHPLLTRRARTLAKAAPALGLYGSLEAARAQIRTERRQAALAKVLRRKIRRALDGTTADIAVAVYDLDEIARRLAERADYDGLTALIAADLSPARVLAGNLPASRRRRWRRRSSGPDAVELASAGQLLSDALAVPDPSRVHPEFRPADPTSPVVPAAGPIPSVAAPVRHEAVPDAVVSEDSGSSSAGVVAVPAGSTVVRVDPTPVVETSAGAPAQVPTDDVPTTEAAEPTVRVLDPTMRDGELVVDATPNGSVVRRGPAGAGRTNGRAARTAERGSSPEPERTGRGDATERSEPVRPRWDALTAEVSAIFSTPPRRATRGATEREPGPARSVPTEPEPGTGPVDESRAGVDQEPGTPVGSQPAVPITERPLPDLVAAAATRTLPPSQVAARSATEPVRAARGVASVPTGSEGSLGSLRSRVYAVLEEEVPVDDPRDNPALTDLVVRQLRLTQAERTTAAKYVRLWRNESSARHAASVADRTLRTVPGE